MAAAWWGTRTRVSARLQLEVAVMRDTFPDTFRLNVPTQGELYWEGVVELNLSSIPQRRTCCTLSTRRGIRTGRRKRMCASRRLSALKHQFKDGQLCLFNPRDGERYGWNPGRSTAVTVAGWAVQWLYAYYT